MLEVEGLNQSYGESRTLWDVAFTIPEGACCALWAATVSARRRS